jgi:hypothetical protein
LQLFWTEGFKPLQMHPSVIGLFGNFQLVGNFSITDLVPAAVSYGAFFDLLGSFENLINLKSEWYQSSFKLNSCNISMVDFCCCRAAWSRSICLETFGDVNHASTCTTERIVRKRLKI